MLLCSKCSIEKDSSFFYLHSNGDFRKQCKECFKAIQKPKTKEQLHKYSSKFWEKNKEKRSLAFKVWRLKNLGKSTERSRRYALSKKQRIPSWANIEKIKSIYTHCPKGYHVDHIIPLKGKYVSGLHVENNLQYLPAEDNLKKRNYYGETT